MQCRHFHTTFHPNPPIDSKVAHNSEAWTSDILEWLKLRHWIVWSRGYLQSHHLHTRFHPNQPIDSKVINGFLCTHLRSLNVRHFGMAEATRLKMWHRGHPQRHHLPTKFNENTPVDSKVISGGHTDTHTDTHTHTHTKHTHTPHTHTHTHTHAHTHAQTGSWFGKPTFIFGK
jgi:hypothetical protein